MCKLGHMSQQHHVEELAFDLAAFATGVPLEWLEDGTTPGPGGVTPKYRRVVLAAA